MKVGGIGTLALLHLLAVTVSGIFVPATWVESNVTLSGQIVLVTPPTVTYGDCFTGTFNHSMVTTPNIALGISNIQFPNKTDIYLYMDVDGVSNTAVDVCFNFGESTPFVSFIIYYLAVESNWRALFIQQNVDMASNIPNFYYDLANGGSGVRWTQQEWAYTDITGQLLIPEHTNRFLIMMQGVNMWSPTASYHLQVQAYVDGPNYFYVDLGTDQDTQVSNYYYSLIFFDETVISSTRTTYIDSDMIMASTWGQLDLTAKNFPWKSPLSFFFGMTGLSWNNVTVDFTFTDTTLLTTGNMTFNYFQASYFNIRVRYCPLAFPFFSNVSFQCWDTCTDPTMYYNASTFECIPCFYPCYSCDPANISLCLTCDASTNRFLNGTLCQCKNGFYQVGLKICQPCPVGCLTCNTSSVCLVCDPAALRTLSYGSCLCITGYTENPPSSTVCLPCWTYLPGCVDCESSSRCRQCDTSQVYTLYDSSSSSVSFVSFMRAVAPSTAYCICEYGYYFTGTECLPCSVLLPGCTDCSQDGINCYQCDGDPWLLQTLSDGTTNCACTDWHYFNSTTLLCQSCPFWCWTCTSPTNCTEYNSDYGYMNDGTNTSFICDTARGYYAFGNYCLSCASAMFGCQQCTNSSVCTQCGGVTNFGISASLGCDCTVGSFNATSGVCGTCAASCCAISEYFNTTTNICESCSTYNTGCAICTNSTYCRVCAVGYIDLSFYGTCGLCSDYMPGCLACDAWPGCYQCDDTKGFYLDPSGYCLCQPSLYGPSGGTCVNRCDQVYPGCLQCDNWGGCIKCNLPVGLSHGEGDCHCMYGYWNGTGCGSCSTVIANCSNSCYMDYSVTPSVFTCYSCQYPYQLSANNTCDCPAPSFFLTGAICRSCNQAISGCLECNSATICTVCDTGGSFVLNVTTNLCDCDTGFNFTAGYCSSSSFCSPGSFFNGMYCESCSYPCLECEGFSANCTVCSNNTLFPYLNSCDCPPSMFMDSNFVCQGCDMTCFKCFGRSGDCTECVFPLVLYGSDCVCAAGYFPSGISCLACSPMCMNCTGPSTIECVGGCNMTFSVPDGTTCVCIGGYYYDPATVQCPPCHYTCQNCTGPSNVECVTCDILNIRALDLVNENSCPCDPGYYDPGVPLCALCNYTCLTCFDGTGIGCVTCAAVNFRAFELTNNSCPCDIGYYDAGTAVCQPCHYTCLTCFDGTNIGCVTCGAMFPRVFDSTNNSCPCVVSFYDVGVPACSPCDYTCLTCFDGSGAGCLTCDPVNFRTLNVASCPCDAGYFDALTSVCQLCDYTCLTCFDGTGNGCVTCNAALPRVFDPIFNSCPCSANFYDSGTQVCSPCHYSCLTCFDNTNIGCDTCDSLLFRTYDPMFESCPCDPGYFDAGVAMCVVCHYSCATCFDGTNAGCLTCSAPNYRTLSGSSCPCDAGYYDALTAVCQPCDYTCVTCFDSTNVGCISCSAPAFRTFTGSNNSCPCNSGYFDPGVLVCVLCDLTCLTCTGPLPTDCTSCDPANQRTLSGTSCPCVALFFDPGAPLCLACDYTCLSCFDATGTGCTTCDPLNSRTLSGTTCPCDLTYYDSGAPVCNKCDYTCSDCTGPLPTNCILCDSAAHRTLLGSTCPCNPSYFDNGITVCAACDYSCLTCSGAASTNCVTCDPLNSRTLTGGNTCPCNPLYFDNGVPTCAACHYSCLSCSSSTLTGCVTCDPLNLRTLTGGNTCPCDVLYFDSGVPLCQPCHYTCKTCSSSTPDTCLSCDPAGLRTLSSTSCPCNSGYFDNGVLLCVACQYSCLTCVGPSSTNCTSCNSIDLRTIANGNSCPCNALYYDSGAATCSPCDYTCLTCSGPSSTSCLSCDSANLRTIASGSCPCNTYYVDAGVPLCTLPPCPTGYFHNPDICTEICGDGLVFDFPCDDGNLADGDGCSSACSIETNYTCKGGSTTTASLCGFNQPLLITLLDTQKTPSANQVVFTLEIAPALPLINSMNFSQMLTSNLNGMGNVTFAYDGNGGLIVTVDYNQSLQNSTIQLQLSPSVSGGMAFAIPDTNLNFAVSPTNNLAADLLNPETYQTIQLMDTCFQVVGYTALAGLLLGLFTNKFIGIEMIGVVQVAYIALLMINLLHPFLQPMQYVNLVNGPNMAFQRDRLSLSNPLPNRITALEYLPPLAYSVNYSLLLLLLPLLFSLTFYLLGKYYKNPDYELKKRRTATFTRWAGLALGEWGLTALMFVLYNCVTASTISMVYYRTSELLGLSIVEAVVVLAYLVAMLVLFKLRPKFFGDYKLGFKTDKFSQHHYWLVALDRVLLGLLLVASHNSDYVGFICIPVPLAAGVYVLVRKPYEKRYNNLRQVANQTVLIVLLVIYGYYRVMVTYLAHFTNGNDVLPFIVLGLLYLCILYNAAAMFKHWWERRKEEKETEKDAKLIKEVNALLNEYESSKSIERGLRRHKNPSESPAKQSLLKMVDERARTSNRKKEADTPELVSPLKSNREQLKDRLLVKDKLLSKKKKKSTLKEMVNEILVQGNEDMV